MFMQVLFQVPHATHNFHALTMLETCGWAEHSVCLFQFTHPVSNEVQYLELVCNSVGERLPTMYKVLSSTLWWVE